VTRGARLTIVALTIAVVAFVALIVILPTRLRFGSKVIACHSVVFPQRYDPIASALCKKAGAYRLRASAGIGALLGALALVPILIDRTRPTRRAFIVWGATFVFVMIIAIGLLATVGARYTSVFLDL